MRSRFKIIINRPPNKFSVKKQIAAMFGVNRRAGFQQCGFSIQNKRLRRCIDNDFFQRILGQGAAFSNNSTYPFTSIAHPINRQRKPANIWCVQTIHQRLDSRGKFGTGNHINNARHGKRRTGINAIDDRRRIMRCQRRNMKHIWPIKISNKLSAASNKAAIFNRTTRG